jgi:hypothetical protein
MRRGTMKIILFIIILFLLFVSPVCADKISDAKKTVLDRLRDPDSAKFGKFTQVGGDACLTVNARKPFGSYVGDKQAVLLIHEGKWIFAGIYEMTHEFCVAILPKLPK